MRARHILIVFLIAGIIGAPPCIHAKDRKGSGLVRDGSSRARAIIVTESESKYVHWEWEYLRQHFPGFSFISHAIIPEGPDSDRGYEQFVIVWRGQKKEVWFDISKPFQEFSRKHDHK
jgi:hypothetical protein